MTKRYLNQSSVFLGACLLAIGCGGQARDDTPTEAPEAVVTIVPGEVVMSSADTSSSDTLVGSGQESSGTPVSSSLQTPVTMSDVEAAYEEGAAQAEEDRLSGQPGANFANDYDSDEENEAYEEGYEDE